MGRKTVKELSGELDALTERVKALEELTAPTLNIPGVAPVAGGCVPPVVEDVTPPPPDATFVTPGNASESSGDGDAPVNPPVVEG